GRSSIAAAFGRVARGERVQGLERGADRLELGLVLVKLAPAGRLLRKGHSPLAGPQARASRARARAAGPVGAGPAKSRGSPGRAPPPTPLPPLRRLLFLPRLPRRPRIHRPSP